MKRFINEQLADSAIIAAECLVRPSCKRNSRNYEEQKECETEASPITAQPPGCPSSHPSPESTLGHRPECPEKSSDGNVECDNQPSSHEARWPRTKVYLHVRPGFAT